MSKRGNDLSQLSKEEYEAAMAGGDSSAGSGGFVKASTEVLGRRKILRSGSKWNKPKAAESSLSFTAPPEPGAAPFAPAAGAANPFSNFSFTKASLPAPAPSTGKPTFAMPTLTSKAPPASSSKSEENGSSIQELFLGFKEHIIQQDSRTDTSLAMSRYVNTYFKLKYDAENTSTSPKENTSSSSSSSSSSSKPLFPSVKNAPPPVSFSFTAGAAATSSSSSPATKQTFSFGKTTTTTAPAPAPPSSGFSFSLGGGNGSTPAPAPATTTPSTAPATETKEGEQTPPKEDETTTTTELESADDDWKLLFTTKAKVYHYRDEGTAKRFALGDLKLQELKENPNKQRMVMRDIAGKVLLNVAISSSMDFQKTLIEQKGGKSATLGRIVFYGVRDEEKGPEMLTIVSKGDGLDAFHDQLTKMSS